MAHTWYRPRGAGADPSNGARWERAPIPSRLAYGDRRCRGAAGWGRGRRPRLPGLPDPVTLTEAARGAGPPARRTPCPPVEEGELRGERGSVALHAFRRPARCAPRRRRRRRQGRPRRRTRSARPPPPSPAGRRRSAAVDRVAHRRPGRPFARRPDARDRRGHAARPVRERTVEDERRRRAPRPRAPRPLRPRRGCGSGRSCARKPRRVLGEPLPRPRQRAGERADARAPRRVGRGDRGRQPFAPLRGARPGGDPRRGHGRLLGREPGERQPASPDHPDLRAGVACRPGLPPRPRRQGDHVRRRGPVAEACVPHGRDEVGHGRRRRRADRDRRDRRAGPARSASSRSSPPARTCPAATPSGPATSSRP